MSERRVENVQITATSLGYAQGTITAWITVNAEQGFGGYNLKGSRCAIFVDRVLAVAGVDCWEKLVGRYVRADGTREKIHRLGHIIEEEWFDPSAEFRALEGEPS